MAEEINAELTQQPEQQEEKVEVPVTPVVAPAQPANQRFNELMARRDLKGPAASILRAIDEKTFPFADNTFYAYYPAALAADEFNRCAQLYADRAAGKGEMQAMMLIQEFMLIERPHIADLTELGIEIVREMYNVPNHLNLRAFLENSHEEQGEAFTDGDQEVEMELVSDDRKRELIPHIQQRRILNSLVHGAAIHQWTSAFHIAADKLNDINPDLLPKYNEYSAIVNYCNWHTDHGAMMQQGGQPILQGYNKVDIGNQDIKASAMNFPVLIHELSKGVLDYLISVGIPNVAPPELEYIYAEADKYSHEQWHYFFGPTLWRSLLNCADVTTHEMAPIINHLAKMEYNDLANLCIDMVFYPDELGKQQLTVIKQKILDDLAAHDREIQEFNEENPEDSQ